MIIKPTYIDAVRELVGGEIGGWANGPVSELIFFDNQTPPTEEEIQTKLSELISEYPMQLLRLERNRRLVETDWRFRSDLTPSQAWYDYCQALRDLPATAEPKLENEMLTNVTWPKVPE